MFQVLFQGSRDYRYVLVHVVCCRRRIEPWEFEAFFNPREMRREACLLYEIRWKRTQKVWRETGRNTASNHVEVNFLQHLTSGRYYHPSMHCTIVWFLSWSPCSACCKAIGAFLSQHPNLSLVIYVARLFHHRHEQNRQGLRDLCHRGVNILVMTFQEHSYCWKNFVNYPPGQEECWPRYLPQDMARYALELYCILHNLPCCLQITKQRPHQFAQFSLRPSNCHFQTIPLPLLLAAGLVLPVLPWK
ncbi:C-_U-editing enzyme APOBEC-1 [Thomomys bottae]